MRIILSESQNKPAELETYPIWPVVNRRAREVPIDCLQQGGRLDESLQWPSLLLDDMFLTTDNTSKHSSPDDHSFIRRHSTGTDRESAASSLPRRTPRPPPSQSKTLRPATGSRRSSLGSIDHVRIPTRYTGCGSDVTVTRDVADVTAQATSSRRHAAKAQGRPII